MKATEQRRPAFEDSNAVGGLAAVPKTGLGRVIRAFDMDDKVPKLTASEVLVFDSSTFIREAGLTSQGATALRHYLYDRGTQLIVPQVVAEECERNLSKRAGKYVESVHDALDWLGTVLRTGEWMDCPPGRRDC